MTPSLSSATLLSDADWRTGVRAIGENRLRELRPMLEEVSPTFRAQFIGHLEVAARDVSENRAVLLAVARAAVDAGRGARPAHARAGHTAA